MPVENMDNKECDDGGGHVDEGIKKCGPGAKCSRGRVAVAGNQLPAAYQRSERRYDGVVQQGGIQRCFGSASSLHEGERESQAREVLTERGELGNLVTGLAGNREIT